MLGKIGPRRRWKTISLQPGCNSIAGHAQKVTALLGVTPDSPLNEWRRSVGWSRPLEKLSKVKRTLRDHFGPEESRKSSENACFTYCNANSLPRITFLSIADFTAASKPTEVILFSCIFRIYDGKRPRPSRKSPVFVNQVMTRVLHEGNVNRLSSMHRVRPECVKRVPILGSNCHAALIKLDELMYSNRISLLLDCYCFRGDAALFFPSAHFHYRPI